MTIIMFWFISTYPVQQRERFAVELLVTVPPGERLQKASQL